jgi:RNA polymerase sigma-70 factor, ECF subfamily
MKTSKQDDAFLIQRITDAQADALGELYDRYNHLVFSVACAILGDRAVAEEVTLDVFVRVWRSAGTYRAELGRVDTWLVAITRHHAIDTLRWQNSRADMHSVQLNEAFVPDGSEMRGPEEDAQTSIQREVVQRAVAQLPHDQRESLILAYFRGYTHQEIAEFLNQPLGTVKTRIRLAMQKLRQILEADQTTDTSGDPSDSYPIVKKER